MGLLKVRVVRGINLACRDTTSSDPYVVLRLGKQVINFMLNLGYSKGVLFLFYVHCYISN